MLLAVALAELIGHYVILSRVPEERDWVAAAARVRREHRPDDLVVVAPEWADPLLREELGDVITLRDAGYADLAPYRRLWALSIRGHRPAIAPDGAPELDESFGAVRVLRWRLPEVPVLYEFVPHLGEASVSLVENGQEAPCRPLDGRARGGGLGAGPMEPPRRFVCDPRRPWLWVGATIQDDLDLRPRYCVYQHPAGSEPVRVTFHDVPLGGQLVLYGDVYYEHERHETHPSVQIGVFVDGENVGTMVHRDGDGWKRMVAAMPTDRARGEVRFDVTASNPHQRTFCWSATTREGAP